ncbi:hypothetical protein OJE16_21450 [Pantoea tagorei]
MAKPKSGFFVAARQGHQETAPTQLAQPRLVAPLDEQTEMHLAILGSECRVRLDLANGDSSLYPVKKNRAADAPDGIQQTGAVGQHR